MMDIRGRWVSTSDDIVLGSEKHHEPSETDGPKLGHVEITYEIAGQDGRRFWGSVSSSLAAESFIGVIGFDDRTIVARDSDGLYQGMILDEDTIDVIYSHANEQGAVVAAHRFKRKK